MLVHPDKNQEVGADEAFKILGHAFDVLGDPEKREKYDEQAIHDAEMKDALDELGWFTFMSNVNETYIATSVM